MRSRKGPTCPLCVYFSSKSRFCTISLTKRSTTSGIARNSCDPSGSSHVSSARRFTPMRPANTSRVRLRRRMASRRKACWEMDMGGPREEYGIYAMRILFDPKNDVHDFLRI
ncbi:Uncharacterised protein [Bordetella pertussis]|nr:Uncharacterised protein [Bordetella pertussis]